MYQKVADAIRGVDMHHILLMVYYEINGINEN